MTDSAARFFVSGLVQGVAFRAYTREQARSLGLRGYARNRDDGRVEVVAAGDAAAIDALAAWLQRGSPWARVDTVVRSACDASEAPAGFVVG
jgi:acylphosphatase